MQIKDMKPNAKNPRKISDKQLAALTKSLAKFGDLSGFVYNRRTKTLVSGHQRQKSLPLDSTIKIEVKHETPTASMTVAEGYVLVNGERFKYREVDADATWEIEALLAANQHGGDWDADLLRVAIADVSNLELTGFDIPELKKFNIDFTPPVIAAPVVQTDEQYVKSTPQTTEQIPTANPNENQVKDIKEKAMDVVGRRFVIIIDCKDEAHKQELKEKLKPLVTEAQAKFF